MHPDKINKLSKEIYENNVKVGWWPEGRCWYECLQLISTEVAEATEGERRDLMDDHLPHRKMGEVELADTLIRTLDIGGHLGLEYIEIHNNAYNFTGRTVGSMHYSINACLFVMGNSIECNFHIDQISREYSRLIKVILEVSEFLDYDIESAMEEKLEYNKTRLDHKLENRLYYDGKKF